MTFLKYSRFISTSLLLATGDSGREEPGDRDDTDDKEALKSEGLVELQ
jgi:hypothetical protein